MHQKINILYGQIIASENNLWLHRQKRFRYLRYLEYILYFTKFQGNSNRVNKENAVQAEGGDRNNAFAKALMELQLANSAAAAPNVLVGVEVLQPSLTIPVEGYILKIESTAFLHANQILKTHTSFVYSHNRCYHQRWLYFLFEPKFRNTAKGESNPISYSNSATYL